MSDAFSGDTPDVNVKSFAKLPIRKKVRLAMELVPMLYIRGEYAVIVGLAMVLAKTKEMWLIFKNIVKNLDKSELETLQILDLKKSYGDKFTLLLDAIEGSCCHELNDHVWLYGLEGQKFLHNFAKESEEGITYWTGLAFEDLLHGEGSAEIIYWTKYVDRIKFFIQVFGLPVKKIEERVLEVFLTWSKKINITTWICSRKAIEILVHDYGVSEEKIHMQFDLLIDRAIKEQPLNCLIAIKEMGYSVEFWSMRLYHSADQMLQEANKEESYKARKDMVEKVCQIYKILKADLGKTIARDDTYTQIWDANAKSGNSVRNVLREASKKLKFDYIPRDGYWDRVWANRNNKKE